MRPTESNLSKLLVSVMLVGSVGCAPLLPSKPTAYDSSCYPTVPISQPTPKELQKATIPTYVVEPPDVLSIDIVNLVPKSPYHLRTLDTLAIEVDGTLQDEPIAGQYPIQLGGRILLSPTYGSVEVAGLTLEQAKEKIEEHLRQTLKEPIVTLSLLSTVGQQQIAGEHIVGPDGTVTLGSYGSVSVVGLTLAEAKLAVENHLSQYLEGPEVSISVFSYNSKLYYVILQGAGSGDQVIRFPIQGGETVLDAISQVQGTTAVSSSRLWVARPGGAHGCQDCILPVDWYGITQRGRPETNYQLMPGDRVYVAEDKLVRLDTGLAKFTAPFERIFGFTLLGTGTVSRLSGDVLGGGGVQGGFGGGF